jgi:hypothetical protein
MKNINILIYKSHFKRQYIHLIDMLKNNNNWIAIDFHKYDYLIEIDKISKLFKINNLLFFPLQGINLNDFGYILKNQIDKYINGKKYIFVDDTHRNIKERISVYNKFDFIIGPTIHRVPYFLGGFDEKKLIFFPPFVLKEDMIPPGSKKQKKLLVSGNLNKLVYPLRSKISELSKKYFRYRNKIKILEKNQEIIGKKYYEYINKYAFAFTCSGSEHYQYLLYKYLEIPASSTILVCTNEHIKDIFKGMGFIEGEHYIAKNNIQDIRNFLDKMYKIKLNKEMIKNSYNLIKEKHTQYNRFQFLKELLSF